MTKLASLTLEMNWQLRKEFQEEPNTPHILNPWESVMLLANDSRKSLARLADGELALATGVGVPNMGYQPADPALQYRLLEVLSCDRANCAVALPKWMLFWSLLQPVNADRFVIKEFAPKCLQGKYFEFFKSDYLYLDSCLSVPCAHYGHLGHEFLSEYYTGIKKLFMNRDVLLVTGDDRYKTMQHKLLDETVRSLDVITVPQENAWSSYDDIIKETWSRNKEGDKLVVACCGPAATILAYDLSPYMQVLDLGHLLVDYNLANDGSGTGNFWS